MSPTPNADRFRQRIEAEDPLAELLDRLHGPDARLPGNGTYTEDEDRIVLKTDPNPERWRISCASCGFQVIASPQTATVAAVGHWKTTGHTILKDGIPQNWSGS